MKISRRTLFRIAALTGIGAGAAFSEWQTQPVGIINYLQMLAAGQRTRMGPAATVVLQQVPSYEGDLAAPLRQGWQQAGFPEVAGKRVLIKPNLVDRVESRPIMTHPKLVGALIDVLREMGVGQITVGDGPAFRRDGMAVADESGLSEVLAARGLEFTDLNYDDPAPVPVTSEWFRTAKELWLPAAVRNAELVISLPKLKTHHWSTVSMSMKNLFGVIPGARYGWPKNILHINGLDASILALLPLMPRVVGIVDGIVGMQGDGPLYGTAVPHGVLAFGTDLVALDFTCTRLTGLDPNNVKHLRFAAWSGLGQGDKINIVGTPLDMLKRKYEAPPVQEAISG
jgi:uncharacterized protein (DUF362 family)